LKLRALIEFNGLVLARGDKWKRVIQIGTKADRAEDAEIKSLTKGEKMKEFFSGAPSGKGTVAICGKDRDGAMDVSLTKSDGFKADGKAKIHADCRDAGEGTNSTPKSSSFST